MIMFPLRTVVFAIRTVTMFDVHNMVSPRLEVVSTIKVGGESPNDRPAPNLMTLTPFVRTLPNPNDTITLNHGLTLL